MPTSMACDELACLLPNSKKLLLYLGKIGVISLELNSEGNNFSFICCAKQRTILLGVPLAWRVLHEFNQVLVHYHSVLWKLNSSLNTCLLEKKLDVFVLYIGECSH